MPYFGMFNYLQILGVGSLAILLCLASGCSSTPKKMSAVDFTEQALNATAYATTNGLDPDSAAAKQAVEEFKKFNSDFSTNNILNHTKELYATDVYFRDPFKEIHGEPEFEAYLLRGAQGVRDYSMEWKDVAQNHGNYYFRWIMTVTLKRDSKSRAPTRITGISHVRFNQDGKVIFHQDYFDGADLIYCRIPIVSGIIRHVKNSL